MERANKLRQCVLCGLLALVSAHPAVCAGTGDSFAQKRLTQSLEVITALSGSDLAASAEGYLLPLDKMSEQAQTQILHAAGTLAPPGVYNRTTGAANDGRRIVIRIYPEFAVVFGGKPLSALGEVRVPLEEFARAIKSVGSFVAALPGDWQPRDDLLVSRNQWLSAATAGTYTRTVLVRKPALPSLPDPPKLHTLMGEAPAQSPDTTKWLYRRALDILAPIGRGWLNRAGNPAFDLPAFADHRTYDLGLLTENESAWVRKVYEHHRAIVQEQRRLLQMYAAQAGPRATDDGKRHIVVLVNPGPQDEEFPEPIVADESTPREALPDWQDMKDGSVRLELRYCLSVLILERHGMDKREQGLLDRPLSRAEWQAWIESGGKQRPESFSPNTAPPIYESAGGITWPIE